MSVWKLCWPCGPNVLNAPPECPGISVSVYVSSCTFLRKSSDLHRLQPAARHFSRDRSRRTQNGEVRDYLDTRGAPAGPCANADGPQQCGRTHYPQSRGDIPPSRRGGSPVPPTHKLAPSIFLLLDVPGSVRTIRPPPCLVYVLPNPTRHLLQRAARQPVRRLRPPPHKFHARRIRSGDFSRPACA